MADLFASGRVADLILGILALEFLALVGFRKVTGRGFKPMLVLPNILAGGFLVLALRTTLTGAGWTWTGMALSGALVAHLWDLYSRR